MREKAGCIKAVFMMLFIPTMYGLIIAFIVAVAYYTLRWLAGR